MVGDGFDRGRVGRVLKLATALVSNHFIVSSQHCAVVANRLLYSKVYLIFYVVQLVSIR